MRLRNPAIILFCLILAEFFFAVRFACGEVEVVGPQDGEDPNFPMIPEIEACVDKLYNMPEMEDFRELFDRKDVRVIVKCADLVEDVDPNKILLGLTLGMNRSDPSPLLCISSPPGCSGVTVFLNCKKLEELKKSDPCDVTCTTVAHEFQHALEASKGIIKRGFLCPGVALPEQSAVQRENLFAALTGDLCCECPRQYYVKCPIPLPRKMLDEKNPAMGQQNRSECGTCGDGLLGPDEQCDPGSHVASEFLDRLPVFFSESHPRECKHGESCDLSCHCVDRKACPFRCDSRCGNGVIDKGEECDPGYDGSSPNLGSCQGSYETCAARGTPKQCHCMPKESADCYNPGEVCYDPGPMWPAGAKGTCLKLASGETNDSGGSYVCQTDNRLMCIQYDENVWGNVWCNSSFECHWWGPSTYQACLNNYLGDSCGGRPPAPGLCAFALHYTALPACVN